MSIVLDDGKKQYTLPEWLILDGNPFTLRRDTEPRAFGHGTILTGDGKVDEKEITIKTADDSASELYSSKEAHDAAVKELTAAFMRPKQKMIIDNKFYINIETLAEFNHSYEVGWGQRLSKFEIILLATDPFFYAVSPTIISQNINSLPQQFTITNPGLEVFPVINITATATNTSVLLKNVNDNNRTFSYNDTMFSAGVSVEFSGIKGTVKRNGENSINNFGGTFLKLLPGDNVFEYIGANCDIEISFSERWL